MRCTLEKLPGEYAVCRLPVGADVPHWAMRGRFWQVLRAPMELTVVCEAHRVPADVEQEPGWHAIGVNGPLSFDLVGVLQSLLAPLAAHGVPVYAVSGFSTDYLLVQNVTAAAEALQSAGHTVR